LQRSAISSVCDNSNGAGKRRATSAAGAADKRLAVLKTA